MSGDDFLAETVGLAEIGAEEGARALASDGGTRKLKRTRSPTKRSTRSPGRGTHNQTIHETEHAE